MTTLDLEEIVDELDARRRFVSPPIRNLDTGEVFSINEVDKHVPRGLDPSILSKDARRLDMGEVICGPVVGWIPASITPNEITVVNHATCWLLLAVSYAACVPELPLTLRVGLLVVASVVNFLCMMLDCLDGMHARATGQCSKMGEALDHWLDSVHTPLICASLAFSLQLEGYELVGTMMLASVLYNSELIIFHYQRVFLPTIGVEGQVTTSAVFLVLAALLGWYPEDPSWCVNTRKTITYVMSAGMVKECVSFFMRFDSRMRGAWLVFVAQGMAASVLYLGDMGKLEYALIITALSFRVTGGFVVATLIQKVFNPADHVATAWLAVMMALFFGADPIPLHLFYNRFGGNWTGDVCLQELLPYGMFAHISLRSLAYFRHATPWLKAM